MRVHIFSGNQQYASLMREIAPDVVITRHPEDAQVVLFTGGTDVSPALYGEQPHPQTGAPDHARDEREMEAFHMCEAFGTYKIGICRGAQFLCVMNEGRLIQHVEGHTRNHPMHTQWGTYQVTSTHHQMMQPAGGNDHHVLGWAGIHGDADPEIVMWPRTRSLAFQFHPEFCEPGDASRELFLQLTRGFLAPLL